MNSSGVHFGTSGARGLVKDMTTQVCYAYTAAFMETVASGSRKVVLGHDLRPSSPLIASACARAISDSGAEVIYAGALPTPALAWHAKKLHSPALIVTGSHIPFDRNGIKFYRKEGEITKSDESAIQSAEIDIPDDLELYDLGFTDMGAKKSYIQRYVDFLGAGSLSGMTVAIYEHSSAARDVLREILENLGTNVISLGRSDDFVPIDTEAVRSEDIAQAREWATDYKFDALLSTDGDADRPLIGNEMGEWLRGDLVGVLCARYLQANIVVTPVSSNTIVEKCGFFDKVIRTRIGSPFVIAEMQTHASPDRLIVGYEANGGFLLGSDIRQHGHILGGLPTRDAVLPMLALLKMAKQRNCRLSELTGDLPARYTASDRIQNLPKAMSLAIIDELLADPSKASELMAPDSGEVREIDQTDGLRMTFTNGDIVHIRPSGNAPELRCYAESSTQSTAQLLCMSCLGNVASRNLF